LSARYKFPDGVRAVGWMTALFGLAQALYFFVVEYTAESLNAEKLAHDLPQAKTILFIHLVFALALIVAGGGLIAKQFWAWWASFSLLGANIITSVLEISTGSATSLRLGTSWAPEREVVLAGTAVWVAAFILLLRSRPVLVEQEIRHDKRADEHTLAVLEATKKMSERKSEDWAEGEEDDEELVESLIWMTQARGGRDYRAPQRPAEEAAAADAELRQRMEMLPTVLESSPLAIAVTDTHGRVTLWNRAAEQLFGWSEQEMIGKGLPIGTTPEGDDTLALLKRAANEGSVIGVESEHLRKDGEVVPIDVSLSALPDDSGSGVGGFVAILADLTRRRDALAQELARRRTRALEATQMEIMSKFATAGEYQTHGASGHAQRVTAIVTLVAHELGLSREEAVELGRAALVHNVGNVGIPPEIWKKQGRLTDEEYETVKQHTKIGADILSSNQTPLLQQAAEIAYSHHERWDGFGYLGMSAEEIPLGARIVAVADAFDALTHDRPYRRAQSTSKASEEIQRESGAQFDPKVVEAFMKVLGSGHLESINS